MLRCNSTFYANALYRNVVVADPLFLPRKSVYDLRAHESSVYAKSAWFCRKTNQFSRMETKDTVGPTHVCSR